MNATKLYFIPGAMCDQRLWHKVEAFLEKQAPLQFSCEYLSIPKTDRFDEALKLLSEKLEGKPINLIGFSLGGYLSASLANRYPELIKKLLIVSSMPCVLSERLLKERIRTVAFLKRHGYQGISLARAQALMDESHAHNTSLLKLIQTMDTQCGAEVLTQQLQLTLQREDVLSALNKAQIPVRFSVGESDIKVDITKLTGLIKPYDKMDLILTPHTGHMFPLESPQILAQQIIDWFA